MKLDAGRLGAVVRKEFRVLLRNRFIIGTMTVLPVIFLITPMLEIFRLSPDVPASIVLRFAGSTFLLLLVIPVVVPAAISAYSVVGEREQGTLEPLLTTPLRREELLLGKAVAAFVPSVAISYLLFALVIICAQLFASDPAVASAREGLRLLWSMVADVVWSVTAWAPDAQGRLSDQRRRVVA